MKDDARRPVEELRRELARQDAIWAHAKEQLLALGDVTLAVPDEALDAIDRACAHAQRREATAMVAGYAVRG